MKKIHENDLKELLVGAMLSEALERDGVDNWTWYGETFNEYKAEVAAELGIDYNEEMDFHDLAEAIIKKKYEDC